MKYRLAITLTLALLTVSVAGFAAQTGTAGQQIVVAPTQEAGASLAGESATDCPGATTAQEQSLVATPLDSILADDCDSACDTQLECEEFCESTLAHCQLAIHCCVCF
jgi:hypothetical protein